MDADKKIKVFFDACSDMKSSKFILAETKISAILKSIVNSPELVSILSDALAGFNFSNEFNKIQVKNDMRRINIILPNDPQKLVAIVFSLLGEIDAKRVYFDAGGSPLIECFERFVNTVILPFRDTLCNLAGFEVESNRPSDTDDDDTQLDEDEEESQPILPNIWEDDDEQEQTSEEEDMNIQNFDFDDDTQNEEDDVYEQQSNTDSQVERFFDDVRVILSQIKDTVNNDNRIREDRLNELNITLDASLLAIDLKNLKIFNALMISLNNLLHNVRSTKFYSNELQNRIAEFYEDYL